MLLRFGGGQLSDQLESESTPGACSLLCNPCEVPDFGARGTMGWTVTISSWHRGQFSRFSTHGWQNELCPQVCEEKEARWSERAVSQKCSESNESEVYQNKNTFVEARGLQT